MLNQTNTAIRDGRRVSGPMLVHMLFYFSCATRIPDMDRVCEIGGGYGAPARLFMTNSFRRPRSQGRPAARLWRCRRFQACASRRRS